MIDRSQIRTITFFRGQLTLAFPDEGYPLLTVEQVATAKGVNTEQVLDYLERSQLPTLTDNAEFPVRGRWLYGEFTFVRADAIINYILGFEGA